LQKQLLSRRGLLDFAKTTFKQKRLAPFEETTFKKKTSAAICRNNI
jgi:hypothetical protein